MGFQHNNFHCIKALFLRMRALCQSHWMTVDIILQKRNDQNSQYWKQIYNNHSEVDTSHKQ